MSALDDDGLRFASRGLKNWLHGGSGALKSGGARVNTMYAFAVMSHISGWPQLHNGMHYNEARDEHTRAGKQEGAEEQRGAASWS